MEQNNILEEREKSTAALLFTLRVEAEEFALWCDKNAAKTIRDFERRAKIIMSMTSSRQRLDYSIAIASETTETDIRHDC